MNECELVELVRNVKTYTHAHITDNKKQKQTLVDTITNNHLWRVMRLRTDTTLGRTASTAPNEHQTYGWKEHFLRVAASSLDFGNTTNQCNGGS